MSSLQSKTTPIRVAVVGLGRAGWNIHIARMRGRDEFLLTDVCDFEDERLQEAAQEFGCRTHRGYKELLQRSDADVVVVASHSSTHAEITIASLAAGKHVIVEKPMAVSVAEAELMKKTAAECGKVLFIHQNTRYRPDSRHVMEITSSGEHIGTVFEIRIRMLSFSRRNDWQTLRKHGGGLLSNISSHYIDMALQLLQSPVHDVFGDLKLIASSGDAEDHVKLMIRGTNGRVVDLEISTACAFPEPKWTLLGVHGTLVSDGKTSRIKRFDPDSVKPLPVIETPPAGRRYGNDDVLPWEEYEIPSVGTGKGDFYDNVLAVLREGAEQEITPAQVIEVMRVIERARKGSDFE